MATDIVQGLFGLTPEAYQAEQDRQAQAQAYKFAQLSPMQQASYGIALGANQLGGAIGQALGAQDPMLQMISQQQSLLREVNPNDINSLTQAAQKASAFSPQLAMSLADRAKALQAAQVEAESKAASAASALSTASKNAFEMSDIGRAQKLAETAKYTPESITEAITNKDLSKLVPVDKMTKPNADFIAKAVELGFGDKAKYGDYTSAQVGAINKALFNEDISKKAAGATAIRIPLGEAMEKAFLVKDREEAAKAWAQAGEAYTAGNQTLSLLNTFEKTAQSGFTGAGSDAKLALSKGLGALGVQLSPRASDTEISNALSSQLVQQIAKVFPGSQSNKELGELPTILRLIDKMRTEIQSKNITYEQGSALSEQERSKFNPKIAEVQNFNKLNRYKELVNKYNSGNISDAERSEAKKIQSELKL